MKTLGISILALILTMPLLAQDQHQSYVTYDDGDTTLVQNDGREVDARVNLPVYPGDELRAGKRGRTEVRLSDGNVVSIDRYSRLQFDSILATYEGDDEQTVARLVEGQVMVYRLYKGSEPLRLDTSNASYLATKESLYGVEMTSRGIDLVTVFEGAIEVRTRQGVVVLEAGDTAKIDLTGVYSRTVLAKNAATEFEQWFIRRASRYSNRESRYLDSSLAYVEKELSDNGRWIYVSDYSGYVWRPYVSVSWRPYHYGYWHAGFGGSLVWVSYESWGWAPYHYGRWAHHPYHGWVWLPGYGYSPAWVYWAWGPSWVGWAPAGWYDCYWGYRGWYYYPNSCRSCGYKRGYGFHGRVTVASKDLRAYTVVDRGVLFSNRIDRAALTADDVRNRLSRDGKGALLTNEGVRVTRDEIKDPSRIADRIIRDRGGSGTGNSQGTGSPADVTQFFQRDPNPSASVRDRVTRGVPRDTGTATTTRNTPSGSTTSGSTSGTITRGSGGSGSTIPRGSAVPTTRGSGKPSGGTVTRGSGGDTVPRTTPATGTRSGGDTGSRGGVVRPRVDDTKPTPDKKSGDTGTVRPRTVTRPTPSRPSGTEVKPKEAPKTETPTRGRPARPSPKSTDPDVSRAPIKSESTSSTKDSWRNGSVSNDPAQRVIRTIGGARISTSNDNGSSSTTNSNRGSFTNKPTTTRSSGSTSTTVRPRSSGSSSGTTSRPSTRTRGTTRGTLNRPSSGSKPSSTSGTRSTNRGSTSTSSGTRSTSSGGRAGISRPSSKSSGSKSSGTRSTRSSGSKSGGSKSTGAKSSSSSRSSSSSSKGKVSRKPNR